MFKRIFWFSLGFVAGVMTVAKANAYIKDHTPKHAREFVLGPDQENVAMRTLRGLFEDFNSYRKDRESQLNADYVEKYVFRSGSDGKQ